MNKFLLIFVLLMISLVGVSIWTWKKQVTINEPIACTLEAKICPDGTAVGRTGPNCEFAACPEPVEDDTLEKHIEEKSDFIKLESPTPYATITSPLTVQGEARGNWYFEASFPVILVNWDGLVIAEGIATAQSDWMTTEFVPFTATLEFATDFPPNAQEFMKKGALILKKDNPSGLPEHDDALDIPIVFE